MAKVWRNRSSNVRRLSNPVSLSRSLSCKITV
ncbi:Uncharacterised protein [Vibrio cholerae]|nr:Uncharacterised protein [Vibrio cholerae]CSI77536.1 Uncharacterised protein [Vibrio cholerae]